MRRGFKQSAQFALLFIFILSFHKIAASQIQGVTADECLERFGALNDSGMRDLIKSQPQWAVKCVDALLSGYAGLEVEGQSEEAARRLQLADRFSRTYLAVMHSALLTGQVALYRRWSLPQKREKLEADAQWYAGRELQSKGDINAALKVWLEGVEVYKRLGDEWGEASSLTAIAVFYQQLKRSQEALALQRRSLALNQGLGNEAGIADNILNIGAIYEDKTPTYAGRLYLRALGLKRKVKDVRGELSALIHLATLYEELGQPRNAAKYYRQFLAVADKSRHMPWNLLAQFLLRMGGLFLKLDLQQDAGAAMQQLEELLRDAGVDAVISGQVLTDAAELYEKAGQPSVALKFYEKVLAGYDASIHLKEIGDVQLRIGVLHKNQSRYFKAMEAYGQALDAYLKAGERLRAADVANNVGVVMDRQGYYKQALKFYGMALNAYEEAARNTGQDEEALSALNKDIASAQNNIGITLFNLGQDERALGFFRAVEKRYDPPSSFPGFDRLALNIGAAYTNLERYDEAGYYLQLALKASEAKGERGGVANALTNQGTLLYARGQYAAARKSYERALGIHRKLGNPKEVAGLLYSIARTYMQSAEYDKALLRYFIALKLAEAIGDPEVSWRSNAGIASCLERLNRLLDAIEYYKASIKGIESLREGIGNSRRDVPLKIDFFTDKLYPYAALVKLLFKLSERTGSADYKAQAFEYADRGKSRGMLDLLAEASAPAQAGAPAELVRRIAEANESVVTYESNLRREKVKPPALRDEKLIAEYDRQLELAGRTQKSVQEDLEEKYPRYVELTNPRPVSLAQVQGDMLREGEVLLEYVVTSDAALAFIVSKTEIKAVTLKTNADELYQQVSVLRRSLVKAREYDAQTAHELYDELFRPLEPYLGGATTLYVVPDAALHYVPFEALLTSAEPQLRESSFLLNKYTFAYVPSAGVLGTVLADERQRKTDAPPQHPLIVFANPVYEQGRTQPGKPVEENVDETWDDCQSVHFTPLPNTEEEAKSIARALGTDLGGPDFNVRGQATESRVKALDLSTYRYVHFATHGLLCDQDNNSTLQPSLVLSLSGVSPEEQEAGNEGFLQMDEILNLKLNADLVTLSACRTGLGKGVDGEGLIGLTRAFMYAGTSSVVVSQWGVADRSTAIFMSRFYINLRDGMRKGEALREAKQWMLKNSYHNEVLDGYRYTVTHDHPYFWAPFILVGAQD